MVEILISTSMFNVIAERAINNRTHQFKISKDRIYFQGKETLEYNIHTDKKNNDEDWVGIFDTIQWYKMWQFMKQLVEQPISIEITRHTKVYEQPGFELKQFVKSF